MAGYSSRQSSFATGDTITAAHSNDEFNQILAAFNASTGHSHDGTAGEGGPITTIRDANTLNRVLVDSSNNHLEFYINVSSSSVQQFRVQDGAIVPITDNDIDLGTSSLEFKDAFFDGTVTLDGLTIGSATSITDIDTDISSVSGSDDTLASAKAIKTYVDAQLTASDLDFQGDSGGALSIDLDSETLTVAGGEGIDTSGSGNTLTIAGEDASTSNKGIASFSSTNFDVSSGAVSVKSGGIVSGNLNDSVITGLSEISSVASDDVLLAIDTSGGGLKKITRATLTAGIATGSEISNVVEDTTPQLGGNLDVNGQDIVSTSNANIDILPNGTGVVNLDGNGSSGGVSVSDGLIDIRTGTGNVSKVKFYCESSNAHAQTLQAQPHSAGSSAVLTLPVATGTLIGTGDTGSVSNAMLATINTAGKVDIGALEIDGATDIGADLADADLIIVDDGGAGTERKSAVSRIPTYTFSKISGDATVASGGALTLANSGVSAATYTNSTVTVDAKGRVTSASSGTAGATAGFAVAMAIAL